MAISRISQSTVQAGFPKFNNTWDGLSAVGAMEPISAITLSASSASVEFNNIPATYTHLQIRGIGRSTTANTGVDNVYVRVNSDSGANYARHQIFGDGTTVSASAASSTNQAVLGDIARNNNTSGIFGAFVIDILDYANTNKYTTFRALSGSDLNGSGEIRFRSSLWMNTNAISAITLLSENNSFAQHTSITLYGIK